MEVGQKAPDITLYDTEKKKRLISESGGKNSVVLFFPFAFSSVCTAELCEVRDNLSAYSQLNAEIIAISVDSLYTLAKYKQDQGLNFTLLSDFNKEASNAFGVLDENFAYEMKGVSKRSAFVIDRLGIIRYLEVCATPQEMPNFVAVKSALQGLDEGL